MAFIGSIPTNAIAQVATDSTNQAGTTPQVTEVIVTGSRIKHDPDIVSSNPITVIGPKDLAMADPSNLEKLLQQFPSMGSQSTNNQTASNLGGNGFLNIDLRNLKAQRTLVLVDSQRFVSSANVGAFSAVDINNIPADLIDHVEILRDGASPIYGSDAVAGVVNFILKKHYEGATITSEVGTSQQSDGTEYDFSGTVGHNFGRGNLLVSIGYDHVNPVYQKDRDFAGSINGSGNSGYLPYGHFQDDATGGSVINVVGRGNGTFGPYTGPFNSSQIPDLISGFTRKSADVIGNIDLNPDSANFPVTFKTEFLFTDRNATDLANPDPQFALSSTVGGYVGTPLDVSFRSPVIGNREYDTRVKTYRITAGFEGTLFDKYDWELTYNDGVSHGETTTKNLVSMGALANFTGDLNNLTPADVDYLGRSPQENLGTEEVEWSGQISGPIVTLPAGDLRFAVGGDYRSESLYDHPDPDQISGDVDQSGNPTNGAYNLSEAFAEFKVPLLKDIPFVKELSVDGAARYSNYSNFGDAETYKVTLNYAPTSDIRFRGTVSTALRAPNPQELYLSNTSSYVGVADPCDTDASSGSILTTSGSAQRAIIQANCNAALSKVGVNPATYSAVGNSQQILEIQGGNAKLQPEKSRNLTLGTVITPSFIPDLQITIDYFRIKLSNQIIQLPDAQTTLNACYASLGMSSPECANIAARVSTPNSAQLTIGGISQFSVTSLNSGKIDTNGIDFGLYYNYSMARLGLPQLGRFTFSHLSTLTMHYNASDQTGTVNDYLGKILPTTDQGGGYPEYQARMNAGFATDDWSVTWTTRFIQGMSLYTPPGSPAADPTVYGDFVPDMWYHDITATYKYQKLDLTVGIQNLFDRQPPYFVDAVARTNSNPYLYDYMGRYFFAKAVVSF